MSDAPNQTTTAVPAPPKGKRWRWWLLLIPGVLVIAGGTWAYRVGSSLAGNGEGIGKVIRTVLDPRSAFPGQDRIVILIAGKDYNHTAKDIEYTTGSRSDTVMLLSADLANAKLSAVSIPRDMRVTAPDHVTGKINGTMQRGGIALLQKTVEQQFGIKPDYHVVLKADAVKEIVNALGGVDVEARDRMFYEDAWDDLKIDIPKGPNRLNGQGAVGFVRFRKSGDHKYGPNLEIIPVKKIPSKEEGDLRRMERQQEMIHAMIAEVKKPSVFIHLDHILDVAFGQVETNLSKTQLTALGEIFKNSSNSGVAGTSIPGKDAMINKTYYWVADIPRAKLTLQWLLYGDDRAGRQLARVYVYGGPADTATVRDDVARLRTDGFSVAGGTTRRPLPTQPEVVYHAAAFEQMAHVVADSLGHATVRKEIADPGNTGLPDIKVDLPAGVAGVPATTP